MHPVCWGEAGKAPQQTVAPCIVGSLARPRHHCCARDVLLPHAGEPSLRQEWPTYGQTPYRKTSSQCIQARQEAGAQAEEGQEQQTREGLEERTHKRTRLATNPRPSRQCLAARPRSSSEKKSKDQKNDRPPDARNPAPAPPPPEQTSNV